MATLKSNPTPTASKNSLMRLLSGVRNRDDSAIDRLHRRVLKTLVKAVKKYSRGKRLVVFEEDDIQQESFLMICDALENDKLIPVRSDPDLVELVKSAAFFNVSKAVRIADRLPDMAGEVEDAVSGANDLEEVSIRDEAQCLVDLLKSDQGFAKEFLERRLAGESLVEIREAFGLSNATFFRRIENLRRVWGSACKTNRGSE